MLSSRHSGKESTKKTVQMLLENGADPNLKNNAGWTALMLAARNCGTESTENIVQMLLENGADPNLKNNNGWTALMHAARYCGEESTENTVKMLLENGADPDVKNNKGFTALFLASKYNKNHNAIPILIKYMSKFNQDEIVELIKLNFYDFVEEYNFLKYNHKLIMKQVKQVNSFHLRPTSIRTKIHLLQMNLSHKNYSKLEELSEYQDVIDYLGAVSVDHLREKLK